MKKNGIQSHLNNAESVCGDRIVLGDNIMDEMTRCAFFGHSQVLQTEEVRKRLDETIKALIEENGVLYPVEIKKKSNPDKDDIKPFGVVENVLKKQEISIAKNPIKG